MAPHGERRVRVLVPTDAVRDELTSAFPRLPVEVGPFAVADPGDRLTYAERARPGTSVIDAVRLGVPLIVSDHDPHVAKTLAGREWVRLFPAGDGAALAGLLRDLAWSPLPRPALTTAAALGVPTAAEQTAFLTELKEPQPCPPCPR
ncbi:hypothetical protein ABZ599_16735 [Streptomyces misionensis]|uniref:hypothetical protein n=1 Tax=Streptomyces misionensis TaxID=67331 RepID=UPI0033C5A7D7